MAETDDTRKPKRHELTREAKRAAEDSLDAARRLDCIADTLRANARRVLATTEGGD